MNLTCTRTLFGVLLLFTIFILTPTRVQAENGDLPFYCPAEHVYIYCGELKADLDYYGYPKPKSYSHYLTIEGPWTDEYLDECGRGKIVRKWKIKYHYDWYWCTQTIHIKEPDHYGYGFDPHKHVYWPKDYEMHSCSGSTHPDHMPKSYGWPQVHYNGCSKIGVRYIDKTYPYHDSGNAYGGHYGKKPCKVIHRVWEMIDWCQYKGSNHYNEGYGYHDEKGKWYHTQYIYIYDDESPKIKSCPDDVEIVKADCYGDELKVDLPKVEVTDNCGDIYVSYKKTYMHDYGYGHDSYGSASYSGYNASGYFKPGTTKVEFSALDICGNISTCHFYVNVNFEDKKPPTPIAISSITVNLMHMNGNDGMIEVPAKSFNSSSYDNCTPNEDLKFRLTKSVFTCDDFGPNEVGFIVEDKAGNTDTAFVEVIVQTSEFDCPGGMVTGKVSNIAGEGMIGVGVQVMDDETFVTNKEGVYVSNMIPKGRDIHIFPQYDEEDHSFNVNMIDYIMLQLHIDGGRKLKSPAELIAADVDKNGVIDYEDLFELHQIAAGLKKKFENNTSYRFYQSETDFNEDMDPLSDQLPEEYVVTPYYGGDMEVNFTAVKVGDISDFGNQSLVADQNEKVTFQTDNNFVEKGGVEKIKFSVPVDLNAMAIQFTFEVNSRMADLIDIQAPQLTDKGYFQWEAKDNGQYAVTWYQFSDQKISKEEAVVEVQLFTKHDSYVEQLLDISSEVSKAKVFALADGSKNISLQFNAGEQSELILYQNYPNPMRNISVVSMYLPNDSETVMEIRNIQGKVVYRNTFQGMGYQQTKINANQFSTPGLYSVYLSNGKQTKANKLIVQ